MRPSIIILALLAFAIPVVAKSFAGDIFSLKIWRLTLPLDDDGDGQVDEVHMPTLRNFEDPAFFHLSEKRDSAIFRAHCDDDPAEKADYPATMLRELDRDGKTLASWSNASGIHQLSLELSINQTPRKNQSVSAAQICDPDGVLIELRLESDRLLLKRREAEDFVLIEKYKRGTFFKLLLIGDKGRIRVLLDSKQVLSWDIQAEELYFQVGCETRSNLKQGDRPTDYGETEFRTIYVSHR